MRGAYCSIVLAVGACGRPDGGGVRPVGSAAAPAPIDAAVAGALAAVPAATTAPAPQTFHSWWGESPMGLKYAVARTDVADRIFFVLSGSPITCATLDERAAGDGTVDLVVSHFLEPAGTWKWMVTRLGHDRAALGTAEVRGSTEVGQTIEITVDVSAHGSDEPIAIDGTIVATVCTRSELVAPSGNDRPRRSTATLTLAGQRFPIAGARLKADRIELSTERGGDCFGPGDERVEIIQWTNGPSAGKWSVLGISLDQFAAITASGPAITVGEERTIDGKAVRDLILAGGGRIGPWSVAIDGAIEADVCTR
jgi:hypothetical protein